MRADRSWSIRCTATVDCTEGTNQDLRLVRSSMVETMDLFDSISGNGAYHLQRYDAKKGWITVKSKKG